MESQPQNHEFRNNPENFHPRFEYLGNHSDPLNDALTGPWAISLFGR